MLKRSLSIISLLCGLLFPLTATAFSKAEDAAIQEVETYLTGLSTIVADFVQISPSGALVGGKFFLSRPGKMRWQYDPPTPILMVANGTYLIFYDYELEQTSHIPLEDTLAGFLARETVSFDKDVKITDVELGEGALRISMIQEEKPDDGKLTLEFSTNPIQLRNMVVMDSIGQETTVALNNARYGVALDNDLFIVENPRLKPRIGKDKLGIKR